MTFNQVPESFLAALILCSEARTQTDNRNDLIFFTITCRRDYYLWTLCKDFDNYYILLPSNK